MKKIYLTLVALVMTVAASAQVFVGGEVGFWRNTDDNHTTFNVAPQIGYNLNNEWALGIEIGYEHDYKKGWKTNGVGVAPFARYTAGKVGPVALIFDGGFGFNTYSVKYKDNDSDESYNSWEIGIKPGVKVSLAKNVDFIASLGFFGYRDNDNNKIARPYGEKGFGFDFSTNDLRFGVVYNF